MKSTISKPGMAGIAAFLLTSLLLTLLLITTDSPESAVFISVDSVAKQDIINEGPEADKPPFYLLIAIGVVGIIGIRRKKIRNACDASCRMPQHEGEIHRDANLKNTSNSSVPS